MRAMVFQFGMQIAVAELPVRLYPTSMWCYFGTENAACYVARIAMEIHAKRYKRNANETELKNNK